MIDLNTGGIGDIRRLAKVRQEIFTFLIVLNTVEEEQIETG
jgi:hypothetical protein